ncbi:MAG: hypothetical protein LBU69_00635 [Deltaproteobacteria bacterium]|nr:hypothetical protein [Deltaproteobacteria bacterium]
MRKTSQATNSPFLSIGKLLAFLAALRYPLWLSRLALALVFVLAAWPKIIAPTDLAEAILGYRLLPEILVAPMSLALPFLELWSALAVLLGPRAFRRAGALILALLLLAFMVAAAQGLLRGLDFDCGCFGSQDGRRPGLVFFLEDGLLFLMAIFILYYDQHKANII